MIDKRVWGCESEHVESADSITGSCADNSSMLAGEADDKGMAAWELNFKAMKTAAYDLGRLPNEVCVVA